MARPSKLSPDQWAQIERRLAGGEKVRDLASEFGVNASAISRRFPQQAQQRVQAVAQQLAVAQSALAELPVGQQAIAVSLADKLRNISASLASAAELGAKTAHRLQSLANTEVAKVDDAEPFASIDSLKSVGVLTKLANDSASIALNLLAANKESVKNLNGEGPSDLMAPVVNVTVRGQ